MKSRHLLTAVVLAAILGAASSALADQDNAVSDAAARALAQSNAAASPAAPAATPAAPAAAVAMPVATAPAPVTPAAAIVRCYRSDAAGPDVEIVCPTNIQDVPAK